MAPLWSSRAGRALRARLPDAVGHPDGVIEDALEVLPEIWRVVLRAPTIPHGADVVYVRVTRDGALVRGGGEEALLAWLEAVRLPGTIKGFYLGHTLAMFDTLPPGFSATCFDFAERGIWDERAETRTNPLHASCITTGYHTTLAMTPTERRAAAAQALRGPVPPTSGPHGPAPGAPPPGAAPSGGYAPGTLGRATLALQGDAYWWTIEARQVHEAWTLLRRWQVGEEH